METVPAPNDLPDHPHEVPHLSVYHYHVHLAANSAGVSDTNKTSLEIVSLTPPNQSGASQANEVPNNLVLLDPKFHEYLTSSNLSEIAQRSEQLFSQFFQKSSPAPEKSTQPTHEKSTCCCCCKNCFPSPRSTAAHEHRSTTTPTTNTTPRSNADVPSAPNSVKPNWERRGHSGPHSSDRAARSKRHSDHNETSSHPKREGSPASVEFDLVEEVMEKLKMDTDSDSDDNIESNNCNDISSSSSGKQIRRGLPPGSRIRRKRPPPRKHFTEPPTYSPLPPLNPRPPPVYDDGAFAMSYLYHPAGCVSDPECRTVDITDPYVPSLVDETSSAVLDSLWAPLGDDTMMDCSSMHRISDSASFEVGGNRESSPFSPRSYEDQLDMTLGSDHFSLAWERRCASSDALTRRPSAVSVVGNGGTPPDGSMDLPDPAGKGRCNLNIERILQDGPDRLAASSENDIAASSICYSPHSIYSNNSTRLPESASLTALPSTGNTEDNGATKPRRLRRGRGSHPVVDSGCEFEVRPSCIRDGNDTRTSLMIRNIPNKYSQRMLIQTINKDFRDAYDFFYLPFDFRNRQRQCNVGYAFINFRGHDHIPGFYEKFHNMKWAKFNSDKICHIAYARIQGKQALMSHFLMSSVMSQDRRLRPIFHLEPGESLPTPVEKNNTGNGSSNDLDAFNS
eukprot:GHVO01011857.1.p1 GENE.GHVO01011857.1~~GHVO01011857.1.p1  ORF type:complete len:677 (-),score=86.04 GHVO01011857.1:109-2139(-)